MALRSIQRQKRITPFSLSGDSVGPSDIAYLSGVVAEIQGLITNLSIGSGVSSQGAGNFKGQFVDHVFPAAANTLQTIPHGLGTPPVVALIAIADRACRIYDTNFQAGWGNNQIQLYCDTASAKVKLLILA